ncbi:Sporulation and spore germination [Paenibacillus sp. UNC496MF]|uniref:GerMN domain-containing protein n=1 Tax=Paenibacillus sp. UNC496MF TaxID=1502753 RepID=UPI0008F03D5C|nr:GerMN domain-containing protein [Paenibacillus sp. UNC496MF]SFI30432.1 Sporulation and spore germination [Paenibacillus sp. UNC496MF]
MKRQMTKTILLAFIAAATIASLSACGSKEQPLQNGGTSNQNQAATEGGGNAGGTADNGGANDDGGAANAGNAPDANGAGNAATGSAGNAATGSAGNAGGATEPADAAVEKKQADISVYYTDDQMLDLHAQKAKIEYADDKEKLTAAFAALRKDSDKGEASLWKNVELLSAKQDGGEVTLDVHIPVEARLGAPGEQLAVSAIAQTYFQFEGVTSLNILVDGEAVESLMGHEDLEHPIKKQ